MRNSKAIKDKRGNKAFGAWEPEELEEFVANIKRRAARAAEQVERMGRTIKEPSLSVKEKAVQVDSMQTHPRRNAKIRSRWTRSCAGTRLRLERAQRLVSS